MNKVISVLILCFVLLLSACAEPKTLDQVDSKFVELDSIRVHYKIAGEGRQNILFVHGFGCDMNAWKEQFSFFSNKARLVFIDLPGYGKSDKPQTEYTLDLFADAIKAVMEKEHIDKAVLVGHSLGTPVCREFIYKNPQCVSKLVDVDGVYCFYPADSAMITAYKSFAESFNSDSVRQTITGFVENLCVPQTPSEVKNYAKSVMPRTPRFIAYSTMKNLIKEPYWIKGKIKVPTLVIASKNSQIPPEYKQTMSNLYPCMDYHELKGIGHFIMMEQPRMFNQMLENFLGN